jgi:putative flippase GtrA
MRLKMKEWLGRKDAVWLQAVKYFGFGTTAAGVDQLLFYGLAWRVLPALRGSDPVVQWLSDLLGWEAVVADEVMLERNYWIIKVICFVVANTLVYLLNRAFVFESGRHRSGVELGLFFSVSLLQFVWIWLGGVLITELGWEVTYANWSMMLTGAVSNFVLRKFVVFKR